MHLTPCQPNQSKTDTMTSEEKQQEFMALLNPVQHKIERYILSMTHNRDTARDLLHDTLLRAYQNFDSLRNKEAFLSYLFTIASNLHKRSFRHNKFRADYDEDFAMEIPDRGTMPDTAADIAIMYRAMETLSEPMREAVLMFEVGGMSLQEIQQIQGSTLSNIKQRVARGRRRLAELLRVHE